MSTALNGGFFSALDAFRGQAKIVATSVVFLPDGKMQVNVSVDPDNSGVAKPLQTTFGINGKPEELDAGLVMGIHKLAERRQSVLDQCLAQAEAIQPPADKAASAAASKGAEKASPTTAQISGVAVSASPAVTSAGAGDAGFFDGFDEDDIGGAK